MTMKGRRSSITSSKQILLLLTVVARVKSTSTTDAAHPPPSRRAQQVPIEPLHEWISPKSHGNKDDLLIEKSSCSLRGDDGNLSFLVTNHQDSSMDDTHQEGKQTVCTDRMFMSTPKQNEKYHETTRRQDERLWTWLGFIFMSCLAVSARFSSTFLSACAYYYSSPMELLNDYQVLLDEYPIWTKCITGAFVAFFGDLLAQRIEAIWFGQKEENGRIKDLDVYRAWTLAAEGMFISGPLLHYAYDWLDEFVVFFGEDATLLQRTIETVVQVAIDILVFDSIFTLTLMLTSAVLQRRTCKQILEELRTELLPAVYVSWLSSGSMAPLQFLNFGVVPVQFRVLVTNFQDVIWSATVSYMAHRSRH